MRMTMIRLTPIPCVSSLRVVDSARRLTRCDLLRDHPDVAHRSRTKVMRKCSDPYAPAVGQHQTPCDEALIKQLESAIYTNEIWEKALDVLCKRIASGEVSDNMLLRVLVSLSKSTAVLK